MKRRNFIQQFGMGVLGIAALSSFSFAEEKYSKEMLTGKGNNQLAGTGFQLMKDAFSAFERMKKEALKSGIDIRVVSGYRSYQRQKEIWNRKYTQFTGEGLLPEAAIQKIIEYSTIPGTSRHHWGTDMDIIDGNVPQPKNVLMESHFHGEGVFCRLKEWLDTNAEKFDFYEVYTNDPERKGFYYEPWHFSYAPLSKPMLQEYKKLDLNILLKEDAIQGNIYFTENFISNYRKEHILDINKDLL